MRENRTYDQVLGDDARGDGDPKLTLFGDAGHAQRPRARRSASRCSTTSTPTPRPRSTATSGPARRKVSDYVQKNWNQNYGGRGRPYDFGVYAVTWPANGFLFDQAERQGISYFNYGEAIAGTVAAVPRQGPHAGRRRCRRATRSSRNPTSAAPSGCYPNDASIGNDAIRRTGRARGLRLVAAAGRAADVGVALRLLQARASRAARDRHACRRSTTSSLPNDHTEGTDAGRAHAARDGGRERLRRSGRSSTRSRTRRSGSQSAIFVVEDDSQDGADHVDAHRIPALVISPYAKRGAVVHTRYDLLSVIRSMELILGHAARSASLDALATPMYDAFSPTPPTARPYTAIPPTLSAARAQPQHRANRAARRRAQLPPDRPRARAVLNHR